MHLNRVFSVACFRLPASFEGFRRPNLNAEQLIENNSYRVGYVATLLQVELLLRRLRRCAITFATIRFNHHQEVYPLRCTNSLEKGQGKGDSTEQEKYICIFAKMGCSPIKVIVAVSPLPFFADAPLAYRSYELPLLLWLK